MVVDHVGSSHIITDSKGNRNAKYEEEDLVLRTAVLERYTLAPNFVQECCFKKRRKGAFPSLPLDRYITHGLEGAHKYR